MANLKDVIYLSNEDYATLVTTGTVTINGVTLTYNENNLYITPEQTATASSDGLMSASDKAKLDGIQAGAKTGTVTSVGAGTGLSISGTNTINPTVNIASGYKLPTTTEWGNKADVTSIPTAYIKNASVSNNTLTLTKQDDSAVTYTATSQTVKGNGTAFGSDDAIDIKGSGIVSVSADTTNKEITISASHQAIKNLDTTATTAQTTSNNEAIAGSGTITLHKVSKTGSYNDLNDKPTIPVVSYPVTDVQVSGSSILDGTVAKILTKTTYNPSTNKIITESDLGTAAAKDFTTSVTENSTDLVTSGAVWAAIDNLPEAMVFKGTLGTGGTVTELPTANKSHEGWTYKVIEAGTYDSITAKVGDTFICAKPSSSYEWVLVPSGDEPSGTVTSVGMTVPTGLEVSGSPITSSGTLAVSFASGYSIPTTTKQSEWDAKQNALSSQTAYTSKGTATKVPQITTNSLGQVTDITEVDISLPPSVTLTTTAGSEAISDGTNTINVVTRDTDQTISGVKTFTNMINLRYGNQSSINAILCPSRYNVQITADNELVFRAGFRVRPSTEGLELGSSKYRWKDLYLSGSLKDGTNSIAIANIEDKTNKVTSISSSSTDTQYPSAKLVYDNLALKENVSNKVTSISSSSTDAQYPSAKAVYSAIQSLPTAMQFKGTIGTNGTITWDNLPTASDSNGFTYKVITDHNTAPVCKAGDTIVSNGTDWIVIPSGDDIEDTWRTVQLEGVDKLGSGTSTGPLNFKAGTNVTISESNGAFTFSATDTTYSSLSAAQGGTAVSLCTTGEKYNWNNKQDAITVIDARS